MGDTTIRVSEELADELYTRKQRGESYADVIWGLLERVEEGENTDELQARVRALRSRVAALDEGVGATTLERIEGLAVVLGDVGDGITDERARERVDDAIDSLYLAADALDE